MAFNVLKVCREEEESVENEFEKFVIHIHRSVCGPNTEDELETYDADTEDDEQYRADFYDRDTVVDVTIDENALKADTLTANNDCSGDTTLTDEETCFRRRRFDGLSEKLSRNTLKDTDKPEVLQICI